MDPTQNQSGTPGPIFSAGPGPEEPPMTGAPSNSGSGNFSGGNDIVLQSNDDYYSGGKSATLSKKPIIIIGAIAVVVVITLLILLPTLNKSKKNDNTDLKTATYSYSNYLLYGKESSEELSAEYDPYGRYTIDDMLVSSDNAKRDEYFKKIKELYSSLAQKVKDNDAYKNTSLPGTIELYDNLLNFVLAYSQFSVKTMDDIIDMSASMNAGEIKSSLAKSYAYSDVGKSSITDQYIKNLKEIYDLEVDIVDVASRNGCIEDGVFNEACMEPIETMNEKSEQLNALKIRNDELSLNTQKSVSSYCWNIIETINEVSEQNESTD